MNQTKINKILIVVIIFLFGSLLYVSATKTKQVITSIDTACTPEISYAPNEWKTWEDNYYSKSTGENFSYKLRYPRDFDVLRGDSASGGLIGNPAVQLAFPEDAFQTPKTNYGEAYLVISMGTDKSSLDGCYKSPQPGKELSDTQVINGITFHTGTIRDLSAGSIYDSKIYRVLVDDRCLEVTQTIHTGNISNYPAGTATEFDQSKAMSILNQMLDTLTIATSTNAVSFEQKLAACNAIPHNSTQKILETTRLFINLPKDIYPDEEHNLKFSTVSGNATAGRLGNCGSPGTGCQSTPECWSYYCQFDGNGEVDLNVKSAIKDMPDYFVRFIVSSTQ